MIFWEFSVSMACLIKENNKFSSINLPVCSGGDVMNRNRFLVAQILSFDYEK